MTVTMNEETQTDTQQRRDGGERRESERSQNIIVTAVHKWALYQGFLAILGKK